MSNCKVLFVASMPFVANGLQMFQQPTQNNFIQNLNQLEAEMKDLVNVECNLQLNMQNCGAKLEQLRAIANNTMDPNRQSKLDELETIIKGAEKLDTPNPDVKAKHDQYFSEYTNLKKNIPPEHQHVKAEYDKCDLDMQRFSAQLDQVHKDICSKQRQLFPLRGFRNAMVDQIRYGYGEPPKHIPLSAHVMEKGRQNLRPPVSKPAREARREIHHAQADAFEGVAQRKQKLLQKFGNVKPTRHDKIFSHQ